MNARHQTRATELIVGIALLATAAIVVTASATPALAFSCADVRGLSKAKQIYWSKRLNLTPDQRHRIWVECYSQAGVAETKDNSLKPAGMRQ